MILIRADKSTGLVIEITIPIIIFYLNFIELKWEKAILAYAKHGKVIIVIKGLLKW